jgi:hypothetical protein
VPADADDFGDDDSPTEWGEAVTDERLLPPELDANHRVFEQVLAAEGKPGKGGGRAADPRASGKQPAADSPPEGPADDEAAPKKGGIWRKIFGR